MDSAFGVPHADEISKARRRYRRISPEAQQRVLARQAKSRARGQKIGAGARKVTAVPGKIADASISLNEIGRGVGRGTAKVGEGLGRALTWKPGLTGTAVLGGTGYALYRANGKPREKKPVVKSAFGVEHVEKAIRFPGIDTSKASRLRPIEHLGNKKVPTTTKAHIAGGKIDTAKQSKR